jgi:GxxExxY protein
MAVVLGEIGLSVRREVPYDLVFHGVRVGRCRAGLVVESLIIAEVKVVRAVVPAHREQVWHQLEAAKLPVAVILNFGENPGVARVLASDRAF